MTRPFIPMEIVAYAAKAARLEPKCLLSRDKTRRAVRARAIAITIMKERGLSYCHIGRVLNRDHSTIRHSYLNSDRSIGTCPAARKTLDAARREFLK